MHMDTGITTEDRAKIVESLSTVLADAYMLYLKTHNFHWNVTGPMFSTLHVMFEEQYTEQWNALDDIAERIRALGHFAPATYKRYAELSSITEEPNVLSAKEMIRQLVDGNETLVRTLRAGVKVADELDDYPTADMLTTRMEVHEKNAWMLRSFLEQGAGAAQGDASSD
ncbi:DNA starvation/stationary phase protection protein [Massilia oculi]|uniref:DNA starvation/stationary phase protection protein n=1 Tax=Massilia hydrophila TaxID=3044279 RepID=A0ABS7Y557_9BURK|nr:MULTISPECIES: Dps family protein [Massilia]MCA1245311.1 DNA starvation/stationary phase protection protein [Massilia sp. MS-15]MCA1854786.1 DNA starvation/stationary phase protection protein [Massilia oculi]